MSTTATICSCDEAHLLPVGVISIWTDGTTHGLTDCDPDEVG